MGGKLFQAAGSGMKKYQEWSRCGGCRSPERRGDGVEVVAVRTREALSRK